MRKLLLILALLATVAYAAEYAHFQPDSDIGMFIIGNFTNASATTIYVVVNGTSDTSNAENAGVILYDDFSGAAINATNFPNLACGGAANFTVANGVLNASSVTSCSVTQTRLISKSLGMASMKIYSRYKAQAAGRAMIAVNWDGSDASADGIGYHAGRYGGVDSTMLYIVELPAGTVINNSTLTLGVNTWENITFKRNGTSLNATFNVGGILQNLTGVDSTLAHQTTGLVTRNNVNGAEWDYIYATTVSNQEASYSCGAMASGLFNVAGVPYTGLIICNISAPATLSNYTMVLNLPAGSFNSSVSTIDPTVITMISPTNNNYTNNAEINFTFNTTVGGVITKETWLDAVLINNSTGAGTAQHSFLYNVTEGNHTWYVHVWNATFSSTGAVQNFTLDTVAPTSLSFISPTPNTFNLENMTFNLSFIDTAPVVCILNINGTNYTMGIVNGSLCTYQLNHSGSNLTYYGIVEDYASNTNNTTVSKAYTFKYSLAANYTIPEYDLLSDNITLNVTLTNYFGLLTATLDYNNTNYSATKTLFTGGAIFHKELIPPTLTTGNTSPVNMTWHLRFVNASYNVTLLNNTTIVYTNLTAAPCEGWQVLNFSFFNQSVTTTPLASTMDATFELEGRNGGTARNYSFNFSTASNSVALCLNAPSQSFKVDSAQQFRATGTRELFYYLLNATITGGLQTNVSLYNLDTLDSTATLYTVYEAGNQPLQGVYLQILRYYPDTNQLLLVSMGKTDNNGKAESYSIPNDAGYRYIIIKNYNILYTSDIATLPCDPANTLCTKDIYTSSVTPNEYTFFVGAAGVGCGYNATILSVYCTSNNPSGTGSNLRLYLYEISTYGDTLVCENSISTGSGTVICAVPNATKSYHYIGYSTIGSDIIIGKGTLNTEAVAHFGAAAGLLGAVGIVIVFATLGMFAGLGAAMIGAAFGLVISVVIGFIAMGIEALSMIVAVALVLAWLVSVRE